MFYNFEALDAKNSLSEEEQKQINPASTTQAAAAAAMATTSSFVMVCMSCVWCLLLCSFFVNGGPSCEDLIVGNLATCVPYVSDKAASPPETCCKGLATVTHTNASCLCDVVSNPAVTDPDRAKNLTKACKMQDLPANLCPGVASSAPSSAGAPQSAPPPASGSPNGANSVSSPFAISSVLLLAITVLAVLKLA